MVQWAEPMIPRRLIPQAVRKLTCGAKNPHESTIRRWYTKGRRGVRLEVVYIGGEVFTTQTMLKRFFTETTASAICQREQRLTPRDIALSKSAAQVNAELESQGL